MGVRTTGENGQGRWKWISAGVIAVLIIIAGRVLPLERWLWTFSAWISGKGMEGIALFIAGYAAFTVLFMPGSILTMGAGFVFGIIHGTIIVVIGSVIGDTVAFLIARYLARDHILQMAQRNKKFAAMDAAIGEHGWKIVLLLRLAPVIPFNISNYLYGLTAIRFWPYVLSSFVGIIPGTVLFVYLGAVGRRGLLVVKGEKIPNAEVNIVLFMAGLAMALIATWYVSRVARRALQK